MPIDARRAAAATRWRSDVGEGSDAKIFWDQIGVLTQALARTLNVEDDGVVKEAVEQGSGDDGMSEEVTPFGEAAV